MAFVYWLHKPEHTDMFSEGYIGVTIRSVEDRYYEHNRDAFRGSHLAVHKAIRKYGALITTTLVKGTVEYCYMIEGKLRPNPSIGYNAAAGGTVSPMTGATHSEETKNRMSVSQLGKRHSEDTKLKMSKSKTGVRRTKESVEKSRLSRIGLKRSPEHCARQKAINIERHLDISPWENPKASESIWVRADEALEYITSNTSHKQKRLANHLGISRTSVDTLFKKIKSGWNPLEDEKWLAFKEHYTKQQEAACLNTVCSD